MGLAITTVGACRDPRPGRGAREAAAPVRRADRLLPGGQAQGRRHVRRDRAGPRAGLFRRADDRRGRPRRHRAAHMAKAAAGNASRLSSATASSCSAPWASPGRTSCTSTLSGRWRATCCSAARPPQGAARTGNGGRRMMKLANDPEVEKFGRSRRVPRRAHAHGGGGQRRPRSSSHMPGWAAGGSGRCSTRAGCCPATPPSTAAATPRCRSCSPSRRNCPGGGSTTASTRRGSASSPPRS